MAAATIGVTVLLTGSTADALPPNPIHGSPQNPVAVYARPSVLNPAGPGHGLRVSYFARTIPNDPVCPNPTVGVECPVT